MSRKAQIQSLLADNPTDAFLRFALAKEYEKEGADAGAREVYEALLADQPEYVGTYYHLAKTLERLGEPDRALAVYDAGIAITRKLGETHAMRELAGARLEIADE